MTMYQEAATSEVVSDDRRLLREVAKQNRQAFDVLYRRYYRRIFHFVVRMVRREDTAEEVVDDVMFAVWRNAASFEGGSTVSTWLLGIAYRQALKALEKSRKHNVVDSNDELIETTHDADPAADPAMVAVTENYGELVQKGIAALGEHHRVVVEMTAMGYSYGEIATVVGCPENTVKTRMFHARQQLKRFLANCEQTGTAFTGSKSSCTPGIQTI
jgi:RNA polymerase sigma-70 factor (ECF subfamily)